MNSGAASSSFTLVNASELEGWKLVTAAGTHQHVFEVWSSGDKMPDGQGGPTAVYAAAGNGRNWLSLNDGTGAGHDTLGIERNVATQAGATYTLSFDYAGRVGYGTDVTTIGIYVDGVKIATYANTSPDTALNWQTLSYQFTGNGLARNIKIVTEPTVIISNGRGAMVDDLVLTEQWPLNTGYANGPIRLSPIGAGLADTDGSEVLALKVQAIPVGAILTDGSRSFTATAGSTTADVTSWNWTTLSILAPAYYTGSFTLKVTAFATETVTGQAASRTADLVVTVKQAMGTCESPLVLDLNGDGVRTTALGETEGGFDLMNTGHAIRPGWISPDDAFVAIDRNHNGIIDDRSELFGGDVGAGFAQLREFDSNGDGVVNDQDARFGELLLWQDKNGNHQADDGELTSMGEAGVASLATGYQAIPEMQNGNLLLDRSLATWADGRTMDMVDVYFRVDESAVRKTEPVVATGLPSSAQITIRSQPKDAPVKVMRTQGPLFVANGIVSTGREAAAMPVIDWSASAGAGYAGNSTPFASTGDNWIVDFLVASAKKKDLASATGLNITIKSKGAKP